MINEQATEAVKLAERRAQIRGAIADIIVFNTYNASCLPDYCTITISGISGDGGIYCVPKDIVLKMIDYLSMNLKAEEYAICGG